MIPSQIAKLSSNDTIYANVKKTSPLINDLKNNNEKTGKGIIPVSQNVITRDGEKGKLLQGLSRFALPSVSLSPLKISAYSISSLFKHNEPIPEVRTPPPIQPKPISLAKFALVNQKPPVSEGKIAPPVPPKPMAVAISAFADQKQPVSEGKIAPPVPPKPTAVTMSAFFNQKQNFSDRKTAAPESFKPSALAMPTFAKASEILSVGLKNKIIKDLNLDNWMGLGGEITPLVLIDFYKKQNIDLIIHANIKKRSH